MLQFITQRIQNYYPNITFIHSRQVSRKYVGEIPSQTHDLKKCDILVIA